MKKIILGFVILFTQIFILNSIAEAASISSRIRALESKIKKVERRALKNSLKDMKPLEKSVLQSSEYLYLKEQVEMLVRLETKRSERTTKSKKYRKRKKPNYNNSKLSSSPHNEYFFP